MDEASDEILDALVEQNRIYYKRYEFIFIVCAQGKSAEEMLALLEGRIDNPPEEELRIAAGEQAKITQLRLKKALLSLQTDKKE